MAFAERLAPNQSYGPPRVCVAGQRAALMLRETNFKIFGVAGIIAAVAAL
jgi:hypothetical protein